METEAFREFKAGLALLRDNYAQKALPHMRRATELDRNNPYYMSYLGVVLALLPPFFIGMVKWTTPGPYLGIAVTLLFLHIVALNVLLPAIVGRRVHLNPLAVTIALLVWGWLWGGIGLILAIPITAAIKVICDHVEGWEPAGRWLGA